MNKLNAKQTWAGALVGVVALVAASCTVDTSKITFIPDDEFDGTGGNSASTGGSNGEGGEGGEGTGTGGSATGGSSGACETGALSCDGQQVKICIAGALVNAGGACPFACVAGECVGTCVPEASECLTNKTRQQCSAAGEWSAPINCGDQACVDGACVGVCEPGDYTCGGTNEGMPQLCSDAGEWVDQRLTNCAGDECTNGICTGGCVLGDKQCTGALTRQSCDTDGNWQTEAACPFVCSGGDCVGECVSGDTQCISGTEKETCSNGFWGAASTCQFVCSAGTDDCGGVCQPDATQCDGDVIQSCNTNGAWEDGTDCAEKYDGGQCIVRGEKVECGVCTPGETRCSGNSIETCALNGLSWGKPKVCENSYTCVGGGREEPQCVKFAKAMCANNPDLRVCNPEGDAVYSCEGGVYDSIPCKAPTCDNSTGACESFGF